MAENAFTERSGGFEGGEGLHQDGGEWDAANSQDTMNARRSRSAPPKWRGAGRGIATYEGSLIREFELVTKIQIFSAKDLHDQMHKIQITLSDPLVDWEKRASAMRRIRSLLVAGAADYEGFDELISALIPCLKTSLKDLRSQLTRETCITIGYLVTKLESRFSSCAQALLPSLINLVPNSVRVMASSSISCILLILEHCPSEKMIPLLNSSLASKSNVIRRECCDFIDQIVCTWPVEYLEKHKKKLQEAIKTGIYDADSKARSHSRRAFLAFAEHFKPLADELYLSLDKSKQKLICAPIDSIESKSLDILDSRPLQQNDASSMPRQSRPSNRRDQQRRMVSAIVCHESSEGVTEEVKADENEITMEDFMAKTVANLKRSQDNKTVDPALIATANAYNEQLFIQQFEKVSQVQILGSADLIQKMTKIRHVLTGAEKDIRKRVEAVRSIRSLLLADGLAYLEFYALLRTIENGFVFTLKESRPQLVREMCITLVYLSKRMGVKFDHCAEKVLPSLINLLPNSNKLVATSAAISVRHILQTTQSEKLIDLLTCNLNAKNPNVRRVCWKMVDRILVQWPTSLLETRQERLQVCLQGGLKCSDPDTQELAKKASASYNEVFKINKKPPQRLDTKLYKKSTEQTPQSTEQTPQSTEQAPQSTEQAPQSTEQAPQSTANPAICPVTENSAASRLHRILGDHNIDLMPSVPEIPVDQSESLIGVKSASNRLQGILGDHNIDLLPSVHEEPVDKSDSLITEYKNDEKRHRRLRPKHPLPPAVVSTPLDDTPLSPVGIHLTNDIADKNSSVNAAPMISSIQSPLITTTQRTSSPFPPGPELFSSKDAEKSLIVERRKKEPTTKDISSRSLQSLNTNKSEKKICQVQKCSSLKTIHGMDSRMEAGNLYQLFLIKSEVSQLQDLTTQLYEQVNLQQALKSLKSGPRADKKEGFLAIQSLLHDNQKFSGAELQQICEIFIGLLVTPHDKIMNMLLKTMVDLIRTHHTELTDWLPTCLASLLRRIGTDVVSSTQDWLIRTLNAVRESFDTDMQFPIIINYAIDLPIRSFKVTTIVLMYIYKLSECLSPHTLTNCTDHRLALSRMVRWSTEPESINVRKSAMKCLAGLHRLNPTNFKLIISELPRAFVTDAEKMLKGLHVELTDEPELIDSDSLLTVRSRHFSVNTASTFIGDLDQTSDIDSIVSLDLSQQPKVSMSSTSQSIEGATDDAALTAEEIVAKLTSNNTRSSSSKDQLYLLRELRQLLTHQLLLTGTDHQPLDPRVMVRLLIALLGSFVEHRDDTIRLVSLQLLLNLLSRPTLNLTNYADVIINKILAAHSDSNEPVRRTAESCASRLLTVIPADRCLAVISHLVNSVATTPPMIYSAVSTLATLIAVLPPDTVRPLVPKIMPGLLKAYNCPKSVMRRISVSCLVVLHQTVGRDCMLPYLHALNDNKMKLLDLYISQADEP